MNQSFERPQRFGPLPIENMDDAQRAVNDWLVDYLHPERAGTGATIGGPMTALLHSTALAEQVGRMVPVMFDDLSIPRPAMELAILLTARHWNCHFEFHTHRRYATRAGIARGVIDAIQVGARPRLERELEDVYDFVSQLLRDGDVRDDVFRSVAHRWQRRGAVELIATVGFYSMLAFVLNVDRHPVPADDGDDGTLPTIGDGGVGSAFPALQRPISPSALDEPGTVEPD